MVAKHRLDCIPVRNDLESVEGQQKAITNIIQKSPTLKQILVFCSKYRNDPKFSDR